MRKHPVPTRDVKAMMIAGCHVRLSYRRTAEAHWTVSATVKCGVGDKAEEQSVVTQPFHTRESAERDALQQVTALLGHQTDRSHSRVRNWR
jgi:hypothetical protein